MFSLLWDCIEISTYNTSHYHCMNLINSWAFCSEVHIAHEFLLLPLLKIVIRIQGKVISSIFSIWKSRCTTSFFFSLLHQFLQQFVPDFYPQCPCPAPHITHTWVETTHAKSEQDTCFCWIENNGNIGFRDWWWWPQWCQALAHHHQESGSQALGLPWAQFDVLLEARRSFGTDTHRALMAHIICIYQHRNLYII